MPDATEVSEFTNPRTDLHTHFAGVLTAKRLIELGLEHDLKVDAKTIRDLKLVSYDPVPNEGVALRSLGDEQKAILEEAMSLKNTEIARELCLPPVKLHCSMLAEDAIKSAVKDYRKKQLKENTIKESIT